jgi:hypothetical protein
MLQVAVGVAKGLPIKNTMNQAHKKRCQWPGDRSVMHLCCMDGPLLRAGAQAASAYPCFPPATLA